MIAHKRGSDWIPPGIRTPELEAEAVEIQPHGGRLGARQLGLEGEPRRFHGFQKTSPTESRVPCGGPDIGRSLREFTRQIIRSELEFLLASFFLHGREQGKFCRVFFLTNWGGQIVLFPPRFAHVGPFLRESSSPPRFRCALLGDTSSQKNPSGGGYSKKASAGGGRDAGPQWLVLYCGANGAVEKVRFATMVPQHGGVRLAKTHTHTAIQ